MTTARRASSIALGLAGLVAALAYLSRPIPIPNPNPGPAAAGPVAVPGPKPPADPGLPSPEFIAIDPRTFEDGGLSVATRFTGPIADPESLADLREAVRTRGARGLAALTAEFRALKLDDPPTPDQARARGALADSIGRLCMYEGQFAEAGGWIERAIEDSRAPGTPPAARLSLMAIRGIIALRRGEVENCLGCTGPSSCIYPIAPEAVHRKTEGSREAIRWFADYLRESPTDLRVIWLLNLAAMTLGDPAGQVPPQYRLPPGLFGARGDIGRFANVAARVGLTARGPNLAGGSVFDDFDGDGRPDLLTTSLDAELGASLYINNGKGFEDRSARAGLADQVYALNVSRADVDNDGDLDAVILRGGWEAPMRLSLLKNRGDGTFDDATIAAGLGLPIQTEAAVWGDYDDDGWVDLFVCGEYLAPGQTAPAADRPPDPRNRCRLYRNRRDGTFVDVAAEAGVTDEACAKGAAWGDFDGDGKLDLFVSNMGQRCRLYKNEGGGRFRDAADEAGLEPASMSFACWAWDYDNDGRLDLYVNDFQAGLAEVLASAAGVDDGGRHHPRLYRNLGGGRFRDACREAGLGRAMVPMGSNFGDLDNDGFLDLYLGTGGMSYEYLVPKLMFVNREGRQFVDVTANAGTGHLQKGHGVSFADYDGDGDLDLFCELGGAVPGDRSFNALFENPGQAGRHWLKVRLVGRATNRSALGARLRADLVRPDGTTRSIYRTVGNNSSFGGNSLVETIGLGESAKVAALTVDWPVGPTTQTFRDLGGDRAVEITEGSETVRVLGPTAGGR